MFKPTRSFILLLPFLLCSLLSPASAQEQNGNLEGTVRDSQGANVPNITVIITAVNEGALSGVGFKREITTNDEGFFRLLQVPPGNYTVATTATAGFAPAQYENVKVVVGTTTPINIVVNVGTTTNVVDVSAIESQPIDTTSTKVQTNLTAKDIETLPKGVSFTSVLKAVPGTRLEGNAGGFQVDGASGSENVFIIDGQEVTNFRTGTLNGNNNIPLQLVQEVSLKSSGFEAEFGGATGGVINVVTKGGNNEFHGEFSSAFTPQKFEGSNRPTLNRFPIGSGVSYVQPTEYITSPKNGGLGFFPSVNLNGPVVKDRLWFFGSYTPQIFTSNVNTAFYTNAPAATRTYRFSEEYVRKQRYEYAFGRLDASPWDSLRLTGTYLWNPLITEGSLPFGTISLGGTPPTANFGGSTGTLTGRALTDIQGGRQTANNITSQAIWTPTGSLVLTGRFSRGFLNEKPTNYGAVTATQYICAVGSTTVAGACTTGQNDAINGAVLKDVSIRTNYEGDATYIVGSFGGRHTFKGGYQWIKVFNDVSSGYAAIGRISFSYGSTITDLGSLATPTPGAVGAGTLTRIGAFGAARNTTNAIYIQDKWQPAERLTLNLGVRAEKEDLPSFNGFAPPINFGWGDKIVPRLGAAYALTGDGKTKIFGSYAQFSDRLKFELPRGSFGGNIYRVDYFEVFPNSGPYRSFTLANIVGNFSDEPGGNCPTTGFIGNGFSRCQADFRIASNDPTASLEDGKVDTNLKPFRQAEVTIGFERQLSSLYRLRARYVNKNVLSAVEDAGVRNAAGSEAYIIGNPGTGLHLEQLQAFGYNKAAVPQRRYDAVEVVLDRSFSEKYGFSVNYTLSRLYGNYSGLASSDESGRTAPGVNRFFDLPHIGFTATGEPDNGRLATDRPHVLTAYGTYLFDWFGSKTNSTDFNVFTTVQSGTPVTSTIGFYTTSIFLNRGDLGRTPTITQTDLSVNHRYRFGRDNRFAVIGELNFINLFDQDTITSYFTSVSAVTLTESSFGLPTATAATNAFTSGQLLSSINTYLNGTPTVLNRRDSRYGLPNGYQGPRSVRFGLRFIF